MHKTMFALDKAFRWPKATDVRRYCITVSMQHHGDLHLKDDVLCSNPSA